MADNVNITAGTGTVIATDDVSSVHFQKVKLDGGGDGVSAPITGDTANGLDVDVTRLPSIPAGTNNIGDVDVLSLPALPAGTNNIGDVDVLTLPALPAGTNNIGDVDVLTLPALVASEAHIGEVGGKTVTVTTSVTRTADTNVYAAGDVIANATSGAVIITFSGAGRINGGSGIIVAANMIMSVNPATKYQVELWLFDTTFGADQDNALFTPTDAELETLVGVIPFNVAYVADAGSNCAYPVQGLSIPFKCGGGSTSLFGQLVIRNIITPAASDKFTFRLFILQD